MSYKASGFFFNVFIGILYLSGESFRFLLFSVILVSGVCLSLSVPFSLIGCVGSVGISLASRVMYIFRVCVSAVWSAVPVQFLFGHFGGVGGGTARIFLSLWLCSGGYGTVEFVRGLVCFSFAYFSLLSVLLAVGCLR